MEKYGFHTPPAPHFWATNINDPSFPIFSLSSSFYFLSLLQPMLPLPKKHHQRLQQSASPSSFSLESVMRQYASQPDLLELILSSKVEEDRRRTEEAKLKRKELDYALISHQEESYRPEPPTLTPSSSPSLSSTSSTCPPSPPMTLQPDLSPWSYPQNHYQPRQTIEWSSSVILPPLISDLSKPSFHPTPLKR